MDIDIDLSDLAKNGINPTKAQVKKIVNVVGKTVTASIFDGARTLAASELKSTKNEYIRSLKMIKKSPGVYDISLSSQLANDIENGKSSFSMKESLLNGPSAKTNKKGEKYNTVPFSVGTGKNVSTQVSRKLYNAIKKGDTKAIDRMVLSGGNEHARGAKYIPNKSGKGGRAVKFVRVSEKSEGWKHPGFKAKNFIERAAKQYKPGQEIANAVMKIFTKK